MRKIRSLLACVMCLALVLGSLTGCGGVSNDTAQKDGQKNTALVNALRKSKEAGSFDMDIHLKLSFKTAYPEESESDVCTMDVDGTFSQFRAPYHMKSNMNIAMNVKGQEKQKQIMEVYADKENDKYAVYSRTVGDEKKSVVGDWEKSEGADVLYNELAFLYVSADDLDDDASRYTRLDDVEDHGVTYQAYKYTMKSEEAFKWAKKLYPVFGPEEDVQSQKLDQELANATEKLGDTEMTFLVDPEKEEIYQWSWNFGKPLQIFMNAYYGVINDIYDEKYEDPGETFEDEDAEDEDTEVEDTEDEDADDGEVQDEESPDADNNNGLFDLFSDCSMDYTVTFSNWNAASEFEIPEEVIKAAEETKSKQEKESEDE